jgi:predicted dehydrogenase
MTPKSVSRRDFIRTAGLSASAAAIVPRRVLGGPGYQAPSDTLNIAVVGAGGMGSGNAARMISENIVAVCDVDFDYVYRGFMSDGELREDRAELKAKYDGAERFSDFRRMLDVHRDIDAVLVATPDHCHATVAATAMRMGKHVYVQKPLTWSVHEARVLRELAQNSGVVTQMGNQGHSTDDARRVNEWIQSGAIGIVREVHVWTNRPVWPQGVPRPAKHDLNDNTGWGIDSIITRLSTAMTGRFRTPKSLDWDAFLGPAPEVDYHPAYQPFNWRGWADYGVGAIGDMGAHLIDHPYWALNLGYPESIEATSTPWGADNASPWGGPQRNIVSYPLAMKVHYRFPSRGILPPVSLHWYDGGLMPERPDVLPAEVPLNRDGGVIYVGERGVLMHETYGGKPALYPMHLMEEHADTPQTYPRITTTHEGNWLDACKGIGEAVSPFSYAGPLTETMLLGIVALRAGQGVRIEWDGESGAVTNNPEAAQYLHRPYREGYTL